MLIFYNKNQCKRPMIQLFNSRLGIQIIVWESYTQILTGEKRGSTDILTVFFATCKLYK